MNDITADDGGFRLLGFPVTVRPGFLVFLVLVVFLYGGTVGLWVAGAIAVFTVIHELGHALAARSTGARASISLDFLMAYAAYRSSRELRWWERTKIAIAGPALQIAAGSVALLLMGVNPLSEDSISSSEAAVAIWWAGIALGALNLLPVLPLDGGAVIASLLDAVAPGRGRRIMMHVSVVLTLGALIVMLGSDSARGLAPFVGFLLIFQLQMLAATRTLQSAARQPSGEPVRDAVVTSTLLATEDYDTVVSFGAEAWRRCPTASVAVTVAQALAGTGRDAEALAWVDAASRASVDDEATRELLETAPELHRLRDDEIFTSALARLQS
jgi:Zn-dependent protease